MLLAVALCAGSAVAATTRILFVGNSFTFVNDLPHQLKHIAASLGDRDVVVANSTVGGCTVYGQRPSVDARTKLLLQQEWDFIVLQSYSSLPTVQAARREMLYPAVKEFGLPANKKKAKVPTTLLLLLLLELVLVLVLLLVFVLLRVFVAAARADSPLPSLSDCYVPHLGLPLWGRARRLPPRLSHHWSGTLLRKRLAGEPDAPQLRYQPVLQGSRWHFPVHGTC